MSEQCTNPCELPKEQFSLWGITYHLTDNSGTDWAGTAIVLARDAQHAAQVFKTNSAFNATPELIVIEATAQIPTLTESGLCIEAYTNGESRMLNYGH